MCLSTHVLIFYFQTKHRQLLDFCFWQDLTAGTAGGGAHVGVDSVGSEGGAGSAGLVSCGIFVRIHSTLITAGSSNKGAAHITHWKQMKSF